jgi:phosphopantetheinyl transferase
MSHRLLLVSQAVLEDAVQASAPPQWLSASEQARLAQMAAPARRAEFIACRYALRLLLAGDQERVADWSLEAPAGQPPRLPAGPGAGLHLSLSHSHGWIACALAPEPVGIDIELVTRRPASTIADLAQLACTPAQRKELAQIDDAAQCQQRFVQLWSLKEAWFKQRGTGVDFALLPRLACIPFQGTATEHGAGGGSAHAWAWATATPAGQAAMVSVCSSSPVVQWALHPHSDLPLPAAQRFCLGLV